MKPAAILQARTGSTRLPDKMLMPFYGEKSVLEILLERLVESRDYIDVADIIVATTTSEADNGIADLARRLGLNVFRGSENDVISRFIGAADYYGHEKIIRICADNVFIDIDSLRKLSVTLAGGDDDYVSFCKPDGTPSILTYYGFFAEGVKKSALKKVVGLTDEPLYHEHVTNYIYNNPDIFNIKLMPVGEQVDGLEEHPYLRLTLDTKDDFEVQQTLYRQLTERDIPLVPAKIIEFIDTHHPEMYDVMKKTINSNKK